MAAAAVHDPSERAVSAGGQTTASTVVSSALPPTTPSTTTTTLAPFAARPTGPVDLVGCPVPPRPPRPPSPPGWRPPVLVPEESLPEPLAPPATASAFSPSTGKGMFLWKIKQSEGGDIPQIVEKARAAGLRQLWVRVGDSQDGFYAASVLRELVPRAHQAGMAVIGWGFPYLHDPVGDAAWSKAALDWRGPNGSALDGFSPDIETATEGVQLSPRRVAVYLGLVRRAGGDRPLVATVYRPTDRFWLGTYPYRTIAPYVDAFAAMVYWGCTEPGAAAAQAIERLATLRPVHTIGQAYNMAAEGGRAADPSPHETWRFLDVAQRAGAVGASFWVWQDMTAAQWDALARFSW